MSQTKVTPLISYLEKGVVVGTRCKNCRKLYYGKAKLITFTQVYFAPPAFEQSTPYILGLAELDHGLRVFAPISRDIDLKELKPDLELVLKPKQAGEGVFYQLEKPA